VAGLRATVTAVRHLCGRSRERRVERQRAVAMEARGRVEADAHLSVGWDLPAALLCAAKPMARGGRRS